MTECHARTPRTGTHTTSWAGDHVCRLNPGHHEPHRCTCQHEWTTTSTTEDAIA